MGDPGDPVSTGSDFLATDPEVGGEIDDTSGQLADPVSIDPNAGAILPGEDVTQFAVGDTPGDPFGLAGGGDSALAISRAANAAGAYWSMGGPNGLVYSDTTPTAFAGGGSPSLANPGAIGAGRAHSPAYEKMRAILASITLRIGKRVTLNAAIGYIRKWGPPAAQMAFGVQPSDLAFLLAYKQMQHQGRGRRGPHLHTIVKRIKRGKHYEHLLRRWSSKAGVHHHRATSAPRVVYRNRWKKGRK